MTGVVHAAPGAATRNRSERPGFIFEISSRKKLYCTPLVFFCKCGFKCGLFPDTCTSVQVRLSVSATSLSEVALISVASASVGPASQTELCASAALALCVLWHCGPYMPRGARHARHGRPAEVGESCGLQLVLVLSR